MKARRKKIAICGYYGRGSFGDEEILRVILAKIRELNECPPPLSCEKLDICVIKSKNPLSVARLLFGADVFIFGGGSLLQNSTSNASLLYYVLLIRLANFLCGRKIMLANGIGPIKEHQIPQKFLLKVIARAVKTFDFISVRDTDSQKLLQKLLPDRKIELVPDPALISFSNINQRLIIQANKNKAEDFFAFIPYSLGLKRNEIVPETLASALKFVSEIHGARLKIVVLNENEDLPLAKSLKNLLKNAQITAPTDAKAAASELCGAKFAVSSRYHGSLLCAALGVPVLSVSDDPKLCTLSQDLSLFSTADYLVLKDSALLSDTVEKDLSHHFAHEASIENLIQKATLSAETALNKILKFH